MTRRQIKNTALAIPLIAIGSMALAHTALKAALNVTHQMESAAWQDR